MMTEATREALRTEARRDYAYRLETMARMRGVSCPVCLDDGVTTDTRYAVGAEIPTRAPARLYPCFCEAGDKWRES